MNQSLDQAMELALGQAMLSGLDVPVGAVPVSYTHLTLPTNREV